MTKHKVLVVDDDPDVLDTLHELVFAWGYIPVPASGPENGIRIFNENPEIRLVVSDHGMTPMTGIGMIAVLKKTGRRFEALLFSAGDTTLLIPAAAALGIRKVVSKPDFQWLREELAAAVIALEMP